MKRKYKVNSNLSKTSGIYIISCNLSDKVYIGETVNLSQRILKHFSLLRKNAHSNPILQNMFNKHGEEEFVVDVLEYLKTTDEIELKTIELNWQLKYPTCISLDSNVVFRVERTEEYKEANKKQLDEIRELAKEACEIPIIIYNIETKEITEFRSITDASKVIEYKHLQKNIHDKILTPYKNKIAFLKSEFNESKLKEYIITNLDNGVYIGEYNLYNLLNLSILRFGSKTQFSLHFSNSRNDKLYDKYTNFIDWEFNCTKLPKNIKELYSYNIELDKTKYKFTTTCNLKLWYESLQIFRNYTHLSELTGLNRKKISELLKTRDKDTWILLIKSAIARLKSV